MYAESVQHSLVSKFSGGRPGAVPITPSPEFLVRISVSTHTHTHTHAVEGECVSVCLPLQMGNVLMTFLRSRVAE